MAPKSGRSRVEMTGQQGTPWLRDEPQQVIFEVDGWPEWEVVATVLPSAEVASLTVQPSGTMWREAQEPLVRKINEARARAGFPAYEPPNTQPAGVPVGGITARLLRSLPVGEIKSMAIRSVLADIRGSIAAAETVPPENRNPDGLTAAARWRETFEQQRPGRRGRPDEEYLGLVIEYLQLLDKGDSSPIATLAETSHYSASSVRNLLHEARNRDLLTSGGQGRAGGTLTPKAQRLLAERQTGGADGKR